MFPVEPQHPEQYVDLDLSKQVKPDKGDGDLKDLDMSKIVKVTEDEKEIENNVFNDYRERLNKTPEEKTQYSDVNLTNYNVSEEALYNALMNYTNLSDANLRDILANNLDYLLIRIFGSEQEPNDPFKQLVFIFADPRVLQMLGEIAYRNQLGETQKILCNKLVYDYIKYAKNVEGANKDIIISMETFSNIVNRDLIQKLNYIGYNENLASKLAMASRSSLDPCKNIRRLNTVIMELPDNLVTEERITATFNTLCRSATVLLEGIMYDVRDISKFTETQKETYAVISLALLNCLNNNVPEPVLKEVLLAYSQNRVMVNSNRPVRFNLRCFSPDDFKLLDHVIKQLDMINGQPLIF